MASGSNMMPAYLRCELKTDPAGIDIQSPLLSWILESSNEVRGTSQKAYHILVSSSLDNLHNNIGDIWDSGKTFSTEQQVLYSGNELRSAAKYWWKLRVWDQNDDVTGWSNPASWITGLFKISDWKAQWIYHNREFNSGNSIRFEQNKDKWIWHPNSEKIFGNYFFRKAFDIVDADAIESADILITADESFILCINGVRVGKSDGKIFSWTRPQNFEIKHLLIPGSNLIAVEAVNSYLDKPGLASKLIIKYQDGEEQIYLTGIDWKSSNKEHLHWNENEFDDRNWISAGIIANMGDKPWRVPNTDLFLPPPSYFRKEFIGKKKIKNAFVFVSALGIYKLFLNGKIVSEDKLTPGWTDYNKRVYYNTYEVTSLLNESSLNSIGIILSDGWYAGYIGWEKGRGYYGKTPLIFFQINIEYHNGTTDTICSEKTWKVNAGPHLEADLLMGETYDASKIFPGWLESGFIDSDWKSADTSDTIKIEINSYPGIPVRKTLELPVKNVSVPRKGISIFDMGQNFAGAIRLKIDGRKTDKVVLRFGEMLKENGELYTENLRMARATDTYYTEGESDEVWETDFTYHGFRFVEVTGLPDPVPESITGLVLHSDLPVTGSFRCSDERLNKLYQCIMWSQRSNYMDIPTDCPQRDERLGWTADAIDFIRTAAFNMDVAAFYNKWLKDLNDAQETNGAYTAIAPKPDLGVGPLYSGAAGWADAGVITPYILYQYYNDKRLLEKYYDNMIRYMTYLELDSRNFLRPDYGYGDWLSVNADTPKDLIATAFYAHTAMLMSEISLLLDRKNETEKFRNLFKEIKTAFYNKYFKQGIINFKTQTAFVLTISFGLVEDNKTDEIFSYLIEDIEKRDYHVSTGFIGLAYLFPVLSKYGRSDVIYKILLNDSYPSWLNMINNGATTMWERWDSWSPEKGFFDPLMNSFNHTSLGVIGEWFYNGIGGINMVEPGFKKMVIKPQTGGGLTFAEVTYNSLYGRVEVKWKLNKNNLYTQVTIPVNTFAEIILPRNEKSILLSNPKDLNTTQSESTYSIQIPSGQYSFEIKNY
jgi:alpha-L-rhamnosidase